MSASLKFRDGRVVVGFPVEIGAMAEIRSRIPSEARVYDQSRHELLINSSWGLEVVDVLAAFDVETIGGAK